MDNTAHRSLNTPLKDRTLWFDGESAYAPDQIMQASKSRSVQYVTELTPLIDQYNKYAPSSNQIRVKDTCGELSVTWTIPPQFLSLDVVEYMSKAHHHLFEGTDVQELSRREMRLARELSLYRKYGLYDVLRAIIWIINTLTTNDIVWGVGRGSSVSSYVLYVIGVHDVDSFAYELDIDDFLHQ